MSDSNSGGMSFITFVIVLWLALYFVTHEINEHIDSRLDEVFSCNAGVEDE